MIFSLNFLKQYVDIKLKPEKLAELLTMRAFETTVKKSNKDYLFDVAVLPNRTHNTLSYIGLAREISILTDSKLKLPKIKFSENLKNKISDFLEVKVDNPNDCSRYSARFISGIKIKQSPKWLKERIESSGLRSINNIVDITNFVMLEYGQPMHAFDFDKLREIEKQENKETSKKNKNAAEQIKKQILVRRAKKNETIKTLTGEKYDLDENILIIADSKNPIAIAGIKGGEYPEIDENTKNIVLESANFNPILIRKTSLRLNLRTDSSIRFEADFDSNVADKALNRAAGLIQEITDGKIAEGIIDIYSKKSAPYKVGLDINKVSNVLGVAISENEITEILDKFGFEFKKIEPLKNIIKLVKSLVGKPYKYGASVSYDAPNYFDCSSFTAYIFAQTGIQIPRISIDQYFFSKPISEKEMRIGDLVFANTKVITPGGKIHYNSYDGNRVGDFIKGFKIKEGVDHVGIYLGNGKVVHVTHTVGKVIVEDLKKAKQFKNFRGARRVIDSDFKFVITVPSYRKDIKIQADLIEEIGRIYGYEKIEPKPTVVSISPAQKNERRFWEVMTKNILSGIGFSEVYNYSFLSEKDLGNFGFSQDNIIELENPVSKDYQFMRPSLIPGILKNISKNIFNFNEIKIFELDRIYRLNGSAVKQQKNKIEFLEKTMLTIAIASKNNNEKNKEFYEIKGIIDLLFNKLGISDIWYDDYQITSDYSPIGVWNEGRAAEVKIGNEKIGIIGEINAVISDKFDIKNVVAIAELDFEKISQLSTEEKIYKIFSKYPSVERDIAILVPLGVRIENILDVIESAGGKLVVDIDLFDEYTGDKINEGMRSLAFHIIFQSDEKTLTDDEVNIIYGSIIKAIENNPEWEVRK